MCFSPKVKMPKQEVTQRAIDPAPLTAENTQGVEFGGQAPEDDKSTSETGVKSATINKTTSGSGGIRAAIKAKTSTKK
ncbi:hypothetical protein ZD95_30 [Escherichia phage P1723]|uniref:Uncharacterized protein n=2 Tax=Foetvirus SRT7 TaxID=2733617 RepID=A0A6M9QBH0_9CAUD|nr:hypothetical protein ZD95_30 [Escherichia phage P1723]